VATVSATGVVTAVANGSAVIAAESDGRKAEFTLTVAKIEEETTPDVLVGGTLGFTGARFSTYDVFTVGPQGLQRITTNPENDQFWAWSRDASKIAFVRFNSANFKSIIANADGSNEIEAASSTVSWSPDFSRFAELIGGRIFVSNADGSGAVPVSPDGASFVGGGWFSPDASKIAYAFGSGAALSDLYVANPDGTGAVNVSKTSDLSEQSAVWSPDSHSLAIVGRGNTGSSALVVVNVDGTGFRTLVTASPAVQINNPSWSPDGTRLAFQMTRGNTIGLWVMSVASGLPTPYSPAGMFVGSVAWGPDGRIAFSGTRGSVSDQDIWVISADRRKLTRVTTSSATEFNPIWKP
jgi:Tol biopolymer transport system component